MEEGVGLTSRQQIVSADFYYSSQEVLMSVTMDEQRKCHGPPPQYPINFPQHIARLEGIPDMSLLDSGHRWAEYPLKLISFGSGHCVGLLKRSGRMRGFILEVYHKVDSIV